MKYIGDILTDVRRDTRNEDVPTDSSQVGISTEDFLRYANYAQEKCQAIAISAKSTSFQKVIELPAIASTATYAIEDNLYLGEHILNVEFSSTGLARDYLEIRERPLSAMNNGLGYPYYYIRRGGSIILNPTPSFSTGKIRITFERQLDRLDIRRGVIASHTTLSGQLTALTIDTASDDATALGSAQFLCINDAFGNVTMYNIPIASYNAATGVVAIKDSAFTYADNETIADGSYVTVGKYTTTHSKLNQLCQRYIEQYTAYKIFGRDSSSDKDEVRSDMRETLSEIQRSYQEMPRDEAEIFIDNKDLMVGIW